MNQHQTAFDIKLPFFLNICLITLTSDTILVLYQQQLESLCFHM